MQSLPHLRQCRLWYADLLVLFGTSMHTSRWLAPPSSSPVDGTSVMCVTNNPGVLLSRDVRTGKVLAVVVAIDRSDEVLDNGFFVEPNFTGSDQ